MSVQISVPEAVKKALDQVAKEKGITVGEAAEHMVGVAVSRLNALRKYAKKQSGGKTIAKPAKKGKTKKAAKK